MCCVSAVSNSTKGRPLSLYSELIKEKDDLIKAKDDLIKSKDDLIKSKDDYIKYLIVYIMAARGILNCRGLLEQLLVQVHVEKSLPGNFNATRTCQSLRNISKGTTERIMCKAAKEVFKQYKNNELHIKSQGKSIRNVFVHLQQVIINNT